MTSTRRSIVVALPILILGAGILGRGAIQPNRTLALEEPLAGFPEGVAGFRSTSTEPLEENGSRLLGADDYLNREYRNASGRGFQISIAYFGRQLSGVSIHSPRNCLPGSGWSPVEHERSTVETIYGDGSVNRYVVEHESGARAVVYYWYQGRGRVEANEYLVKWNLLRDAMLRRRTDEALVRLVFPVRRNEEISSVRATAVVQEVAEALSAHLPS